jgi:hypothetical protein
MATYNAYFTHLPEFKKRLNNERFRFYNSYSFSYTVVRVLLFWVNKRYPVWKQQQKIIKSQVIKTSIQEHK